MSYAEYGSRIFLPKSLKTEKFLIHDDEIAQVRSGHRLKMYDSFLDIRAWSPKNLETFQYFREVTENPYTGKIVPIDYLVDIVNDLSTQSEVALLRQELEVYKSLKLTPEQEKQLRRKFRKEEFNNNDSKEITEDESPEENLESRGTIDENSRLPISDETDTNIDAESNLNSYSNFASTLNLFEGNKSYDSDETSRVASNSYTMDDEGTLSERSCDSQRREIESLNSECVRIIKNESTIISLENDLVVKKAELEELKEVIKNLKISLEERDNLMKTLEDRLMNTQRQLKQVVMERNCAIEECKKLSDDKKLIDQLKTKWEEKRQQCLQLSQELEKLRAASNDNQLRTERDNLQKKLDVLCKLMESVGCEPSANGLQRLLREKKELMSCEKEFRLQCLDYESEIERLSQLINRVCNENQKQQADREHVIDNLTAELQSKDAKLSEYKKKISLMSKDYEKIIFHEKLLHESTETDASIDNILARYLKQTMQKFSDFSEAFEYLRSNADDTTENKSEIEKLKVDLMDTIEKLRDQIVKKTDEVKSYIDRYRESQKIVEAQSEELKQLREANQKYNDKMSIIDELQKSASKMELKFVELHKQHYNLTNTIQNLTGELAMKNGQIVELENEKDTLFCKVKRSSNELRERDAKISALREENSKIEKKLKEAEENAAIIREEMKQLKHENDLINQLSFLQKEIMRCGKDKKKLEENILSLREDFKTQRASNETLTENLNDKLEERKSLESKIATMKQNISNLSDELKFSNFDKTNIANIPTKLCESISALKQRFHTTYPPADQLQAMQNDSMEKDVDEYQKQLFDSNEETKVMGKSEIFFKRNVQYVDSSRDGLPKVHFKSNDEGKNKMDSVGVDHPKISVFKNQSVLMGQGNLGSPPYYKNTAPNPRYMKDVSRGYQYVPKSEALPSPNKLVDSSKNFITTCSARRKNENF